MTPIADRSFQLKKRGLSGTKVPKQAELRCFLALGIGISNDYVLLLELVLQSESQKLEASSWKNLTI